MAKRAPLSFSLITAAQWVQRVRLSLAKRPVHGVMLDEPVAIEHEEVARGVGRFVDAVELGRIPRSAKVDAGAVACRADRRRHAPLHPGDGVGKGPALFRRRVASRHPGHKRPELGDVALREGELRLLLAAIGMADRHRVALRGLRCEFLEMGVRRAVLVIGTAAERGERQAQ